MLVDEAREVANRYPAGRLAGRWESLGNRGGLSGSSLWRMREATSEGGGFCLKRWPATHPTRRQLAWIHARLLVASSGSADDERLPFVPVPLLTDEGDSMVERHGQLWELTRWLPGTADFRQRPSPARLRSAGDAIARLHRNLWHTDDARQEVAPGLLRRWQGIQPDAWNEADLTRWRHAARHADERESGRVLESIVEELPRWRTACLEELTAALRHSVPVQACVRDLWHAHLLYQEDELTGIVDYGAMQVDSVCADLTRWLGSCLGGLDQGWTVGLDAYAARRPLSPAEMDILPAFEMGTALLSAIQWLRWTCDERRTFDDSDMARRRLQEVLARLQQGPRAVSAILRDWRGG